MIKKFPLAGATSFVLATLFMVSPIYAQSSVDFQSLSRQGQAGFPTIIQIAPPSAEQLAAIERAAILKAAAHRQDPLAAEQERKARRQAAFDGMTLEAWMSTFSKDKRGNPIGNAGIDRVFDWAEGTMDRWEQNQSRKAISPKPYSPMEIKTLLPELEERERLGREIAIKKGTTLEAELLNTMIKNKMDYSQIDRSMGWPVGTMAQWDRNQTAATNSTNLRPVYPKADDTNLRPAVSPPTVPTALPTQATIIQIAPPSAKQAGANALSAALEVKTKDPSRVQTERLARERAVREGTTLEAKLYKNAKIKNNLSNAQIDKSMAWPTGTMNQWEAGRWGGRAGELEQSAMWRYAKANNMTTKQLDAAMGWTPGTMDTWAVKNGFMPAPRGKDLKKGMAINSSIASQAASNVQKENQPIPLNNSTVEQDSSLVSKKVEAPDRAVSQPRFKPNVCELNPGKFKGCSAF